MRALDIWLERATRGLSEESAAQVRREIADHYQSARDAVIEAGAAVNMAEQSALSELGEASAANRQYRRVLLTAAEARLLRADTVEARALRAVDGRFYGAAFGLPVCALGAAAALNQGGAEEVARVALAVGIGSAFWLTVPRLPIDTPVRSRIFRALRWLVQAGTLWLAFGPDALNMIWLMGLVLGSLAWTEWTRASIRRKLSPPLWPKHLYL